jgi:Spy/CpxP family protein refolding chaperone
MRNTDRAKKGISIKKELDMKRRLIAVVLIALFALSVTALAVVDKGARKEQMSNPGQRIAAALGLSDQQSQQIRDQLKGYYEQVKSILQSDLTKEQKMAEIQPIKDRTAAAIMAILTPEQQAKAQELGIIDRMLSPMKQSRDRLACALEQLNLTDAQKAQIQGILAEMKEAAKAIHDDANLTDEQKKTQFIELKKTTLEKVNAVLTPEQQAQLKELMQQKKKNRPGPGAGNTSAPRGGTKGPRS